jgi:oligopeptide/dipeptide ABC transporter ATP-binding protein
MNDDNLLLDVKGLTVRFPTSDGVVQAVSDVSFSLARGETLGVVGESGSGKSVSNLAIMGLLNRQRTAIAGEVLFKGRDLLTLPPDQLRHVRGKEIAMVFQDPVSALNPVMTIGAQLTETLRQTGGVRRERERLQRAIELPRLVGVPEPDRRLRAYPHELSGGMAQRVVIALALVGEPRLLLADEPTSALDVTVQAQILQLLVDLQQRLSMSVLLVSHDLGVVAQTCKRVYVMYAGEIVEEAPVATLFAEPRHPYTVGLLSSIPSIEHSRPTERLPAIPGSPPDLGALPDGCRFHPRCPLAVPECRRAPIALRTIAPEHRVACLRHDEVSRGNVIFSPLAAGTMEHA